MREKISWNDDYTTGIVEIDVQHKKIIADVNTLCSSICEKKDKNEIKNLLEDFDYFTKTHFDLEEKYMKIYDFEGYSEHKKAHKFFKKLYNQIRYNYFYVDSKNMPKEEVIRTYSIHLCVVLRDWLDVHFSGFDKDLVDFLRTKKGE